MAFKGIHKYTPREAINIASGQVGSVYMEEGEIDKHNTPGGPTLDGEGAFEPDNGVIVGVQFLGVSNGFCELKPEFPTKFPGTRHNYESSSGMADMLTAAQKGGGKLGPALNSSSTNGGVEKYDDFLLDFNITSNHDLVGTNMFTATNATFQAHTSDTGIFTNDGAADGLITLPLITETGKKYSVEWMRSFDLGTNCGNIVGTDATILYSLGPSAAINTDLGWKSEFDSASEHSLYSNDRGWYAQDNGGNAPNCKPNSYYTATGTTSYLAFQFDSGTSSDGDSIGINYITVRKIEPEVCPLGYESKGDPITEMRGYEMQANSNMGRDTMGVTIPSGVTIYGRWTAFRPHFSNNINSDQPISMGKYILYIGG